MKNIFLPVFTCLLMASCHEPVKTRNEISLNGIWEITRTDSFTVIPDSYTSKIPVPGLVDMSEPAVDKQDTLYENAVYWYRRTFKLDDPERDVIRLKINKARYHTRVFVNGKPAGENIYNFTPSVFDIKPFLNGIGAENDLVIAIGCKNNLPDTVTNGWDFEKIKYIPGIYDDVKIILSDYPFIRNVQVAPDIENESVRVVAEVETELRQVSEISYTVRESLSKKVISSGSLQTIENHPVSFTKFDFSASIDSCRLWSPDDPFLYELELSTSGDNKTTRFGMRSFAASPDSGVFVLNGKPFYMRGTNVCIYRFFEDPDRAGLPWDGNWVVKLHSKFREMHWTTIRYCIGFPPEKWYEIADSLGFLIQDEYPLWTLGRGNFEKYLGNLSPVQLAAEYREWMRERWNHPCVVIWDAQNESITEVTGKAIGMVRSLDLSERPWDNGWAPPASAGDAIESHPYLFSRYQRQKPSKEGYLKELFTEVRIPGNDPNSHFPLPEGRRYENPIILNEYGWIWLNRNGSTTTLTDKVYENVFPKIKTPEERLEVYAKNLGILTEYWRGHRKAAAVMHFCGLGYSRPERPRGQTSDHFIDIRNLTFEPNFYKYVRPAFSPVGVMVEFWDNTVRRGKKMTIPVHIINDTYTDLKSDVKLTLLRDGSMVHDETVPVEIPALGKKIINIQLVMPMEVGSCRMTAEIIYNGESVKSIREFTVKRL